MKIAEESRRHRALLVDMGDESAKLKFSGASGAAKGVAVGGARWRWAGDVGGLVMVVELFCLFFYFNEIVFFLFLNFNEFFFGMFLYGYVFFSSMRKNKRS